MPKSRSKRLFITLLKVIGWVSVSIVAFLLIIALTVRMPAVQNFIVSKIEDRLKSTLGTDVSIKNAYINFPKSVEITEFYLKDLASDTLLYFNSLEVDADLWQLTNNKIELNSIDLIGTIGYIKRTSNSEEFNFQFIIDAFSGDSTSTKTASTPWQIEVDEIDINNFRFSLADKFAGMTVAAKWKELGIEINELDLTQPKLLVNSIFLNQADIKYHFENLPSASDSSTSSKSNFELGLEELTVMNSILQYGDSYQKINADIGNLDLETKEFSLLKTLLSFDEVQLSNTKIRFQKLNEAPQSSLKKEQSASPWIVSATKIEFSNNEIIVVADSSVNDEEYFNPQNFKLKNLDLTLNEASYSDEEITGKIDELSFQTDGQNILLEAECSLTENSLNLNEISLFLNDTQIDTDFESSFTALSNIAANSTNIDFKVDPSEVYLADLRYFLPSLPPSKLPNKITLEADIQGSLAQLDINALQVSSPLTNLTVNGSINNLLMPDSTSYTLDSVYIASQYKEIEPFLPDSLATSITLPKLFRISATGSGSFSKFQGDINLKSSYGEVMMNNLTFDMLDTIPTYSGELASNGFEVGKILNQANNFDSLIFDIKVDGEGSSISNLNTVLSGKLEHIIFNDYAYDSISINGSLTNSLIDLKVKLIDEYAAFVLAGKVDISPTLHKNQLRFDLQKADLQRLNFTAAPLKIKGIVDTDFTTKEFRRFNGSVAIRNFEADNGIDVYKIDSLLAASIDEDGKTEINIDSDILEGRFTGNVDLYSISTAIEQHVNQYYDFIEVPDEEEEETFFTFDLDIKKTDLITNIIIPKIGDFIPGRLHAEFNTVKDQLDIDLSIHHITYNDIALDSIKLTTSSSQGQLRSKLSVEELATGNSSVKNVSLAFDFNDNMVKSKFTILDSLSAEKYLVQLEIEAIDSAYQLMVEKNGLILNYNKWVVQQNRPILLGKYYDAPITTLQLTQGNQQVSIETDPLDSMLHILFDQFRLQTVSDALKKDETLLNGVINGNLDIGLNNSLGITSDLSIDQLSVLGSLWGDFKFNSKQLNKDSYVANLDLVSSKNDINIQSIYDLRRLEELELTLDVKKFELNTIAPFVDQSIDNISGIIKANATLSNGLSEPSINGSLNFENISLKPVALNNQLSVTNEKIDFTNSTISLNEFRVKDQFENLATLNGTVELVDFAFYNFDLNLSIQDFLLINTTANDNDSYYGKLKTDGNLYITGSSARPTVDMKLKLSEESEFTYVIPESEYNATSTENTVRFVSKKEDDDVEKTTVIANDSINFQGIDLTATIEIDKQAKFKVIIDPVTEDQLSVQGNANLNLKVDRNGEIKLNGRYILEDGSYDFSFYKLVKRKFKLEKGSSIVWSGDPFDAELDIKAYNLVEASPLNLMTSQGGTSGIDVNQFKQRLPFLVYININGELMQPDIRFELDMPEDKQGAIGGTVYAKIRDINSRESDLNKQAFALLTLQSFIADDPLQGDGGYDLEDRARSSVNRLLSDQLNRLTDDIKAVNLNLDLQSYDDYSSGAETSTTVLELGLSKSLFDDKLEVKVAGNINLEGAQQEGLSDYVGDLALEYKITDDGRLRITGFRRSDFDVISGEVIETGAGIIYVRDYNSFKELFKGRDEN